MRNKSTSGMTLLEVTLAIAIFAVTMGVASQGLVSFYSTLDMQRLRVIAVNRCLAIFGEMRNLRDANLNTPENPNNFQSNILSRYQDGWEGAGPIELRNSTISVTYEDGSPTANPLVPTVRIQWEDLRGHVMTLQVSSAITDR
jgi:prepilin-type N-terminal cleavage/methylation domain-containing protein